MRLRVDAASALVAAYLFGGAESATVVRPQNFATATRLSLDAYALGSVAATDSPIAVQVRQRSLNAVVGPLREGMESWIGQGSGLDRDRRAALASIFALEVLESERSLGRWFIVSRHTDRRLHEQAASVLIAWCTSQITKWSSAERQRAWLLAAIALAEAAGDLVVANRLGRLALDRWPDVPAIAFSAALLCERNSYPDVRSGRFEGRSRAEDMAESERLKSLPVCQEQFGRLLGDGRYRDEAALHIAFLDFRQARPAAAQDRLTAALTQNSDPFVRHLAFLLRGQILRAQGRQEEAGLEFAQALDAVPGQTAATLLASVRFAAGLPESPTGVSILLSAGDTADPWRLYGLGDFRRWSELLRSARGAAQ